MGGDEKNRLIRRNYAVQVEAEKVAAVQCHVPEPVCYFRGAPHR